MSTPRRLSYYGYVDRPYEAVRRLLLNRADELFQRATTTASERAISSHSCTRKRRASKWASTSGSMSRKSRTILGPAASPP